MMSFAAMALMMSAGLATTPPPPPAPGEPVEWISGALGAGIDDADDPFSKATWPVELAIVELARRPHALTVRLDDGGTALTVNLVENVGNHYPLGSNQAAPDVFWDGFEV
jgi:hypothetical protein